MWFREWWWGIRYGQLGWHARKYHLLLERQYYRWRFWSDPMKYSVLLTENQESGAEHMNARNEWR